MDEEFGFLEFSDGDGPFACGYRCVGGFLETSLLGDLDGRINVEFHAVDDVLWGGGEVLHGDVVFKTVLSHGNISTVFQVLVVVRDAFEDHAIERHFLGTFLRNEVALQGGAVKLVDIVLLGDHFLAVFVLP